MTDPTLPVVNEPLRFERAYTTEADYPIRFTRAFFGFTFSRPRRWIPVALILVLFLIAFVVSDLNASPLIFPSVYIGLLVLLYGIAYFATVRQMRRRVPVGSVFGIGFRSETFVVSGPQVTSEVAYSLYKSCQRWGRFVVLRQRVSRISSFLPEEIFADESLDFLRSRITPTA